MQILRRRRGSKKKGEEGGQILTFDIWGQILTFDIGLGVKSLPARRSRAKITLQSRLKTAKPQAGMNLQRVGHRQFYGAGTYQLCLRQNRQTTLIVVYI